MFLHIYFAEKFHKVLFLAPGGKTVFQGKVLEAENYFERLGFQKPDKVNPADFFMDAIGGMLESKQSEFTSLPEKWEQYASENNTGAESAGDPDSPVTSEPDVEVKFSFNNPTDVSVRENQGIMQ